MTDRPTLHEQLHEQESTFEWMLRALGGVAQGETSPMLARPNAAEANLLLPLTTRAAAEAGLRRNHDDRGIRDRLQSTAGRAASRFGLLRFAGGDVVQFPATQVLISLQRVFGDPDLTAAISAGPPRRNRKPVLMLIRPNGEVVGFAKVGWSDFTRGLVRNEHSVLELVDSRLPTPIVTPAPIAIVEAGDCVVSVTTAIRATDWTRPRALTPEQIDTIGTSVGFRSVTVADLAWLGDPDFGSRDDQQEHDLETAVRSVSREFAAEKLDVGLWHGDLNPWNLISGGSSVGVIDWEFAGLDRPVGQDRRHLRFEAIRRATEADPEAAVNAFVKDELSGSSSEVELAVYLADLAIRESRLSGQGWSGVMAGFRHPLTAALEDLLT